MSALKYKDTDGTWKEVTSLNQVVTVEKEVIVTDMSNLEWKEIEVPVTAGYQYQIINCSAANIDLLSNKNWVLYVSSKEIDSWYDSYYPVASGTSKPIIISPYIANLKGNREAGIYTLDVDGYGFGGFGTDFYVYRTYAPMMNPGVNTASLTQVHSNYIMFEDCKLDATAKLIYLADKEA